MARSAPKAPPPGGSVSSRGGRVDVRSRGHLEVDMQRLAATLGPAVVGHVLMRVDENKDVRDRPLKRYSPGYAEWLRSVGEDPNAVDLRLTGGMLNSVHVRDTEVTADGLTLTVGPGTGTSERRSFGGTHGEDAGKRTTNRRGPPHNLVGKYLSKLRPWLGISPSGMKLMKRLIERSGVFKGGV
jgi:hypothetical protein